MVISRVERLRANENPFCSRMGEYSPREREGVEIQTNRAVHNKAEITS